MPSPCSKPLAVRVTPPEPQSRHAAATHSINAIPVGAPVGARRLFRVALRAGLRAVMRVSHEVGRESDDEMIAPLGAAAPRSAPGRLVARRLPLWSFMR